MDIQTEINEILGTGITQEALAARLDCSQAAISAFKNGKRGKRPSRELGNRVAAVHAELVRPRRASDARRA